MENEIIEINQVISELLKKGISEPLELNNSVSAPELMNKKLADRLKKIGVYNTIYSHLLIYDNQLTKIEKLLEESRPEFKDYKKLVKKIYQICRRLEHLNSTCVWDPR